MAVAEPCLKKDWEEWKREMEEKRSARWKEKVSYWANLEASDNEEEEEEEEATEREEEEGKEKGGERREIGMRVEVKGNGEEGEVTEWEEGEDDTDVIEDESVEEDVNNEVALEEDEGVMDVKVEELLTKAEENDNEEGEWDEEEHRELGETREHDTAEQDRERPEDQIEEEKSVAEPQTGVAEQLQKDRKDPHLMEEDEAIEVEKEVPERAGAVGKAMMHVQVHADEEGQELEHIGENDLAEQVDKTGKMDEVEVAGNLSEYDNEEEDCYKERINDEEQAFPNQQKNENSHLEGQHKFTDEAEVAAGSLPDDFQDLEEEEESDEEEAGDYNSFDEDVLKTYSKEGYLCEIFGILKDFRDASLFTDLTLSAADGRSFHTHAPVLAAVSSRICEDLRGRTMENNRIHICLGPEVDAVGLEAVVEFAYSGFISCLNEDTVHQIKTTAGTLGACRVTELCTEQEEKAAETGDGQKEQSVLTEQQITLRAIKQMWMEKVGCDIILEAIGGSLHGEYDEKSLLNVRFLVLFSDPVSPAHRVILAACSDYFRCMFTSGMRECRQPQVTLPSLLASELEALISCSYSGALPLSWSCVFEITSTALQLQYQPVLRLCLDFLQREIDPHFCLDVASFAEAYALTELLHVSHDYVARQFQKVASTPKFKDLPAAQLLRYLHSRSLCVPSELIVFKAVVAWIQAKPKKRLGLTKELMRTIHFPLMTYKEFKEVRSLKMWSDHGLEELYEAIFEEFCGSEATPQSQYRTYLPKETLVVIGGDQTFEDLGSRRICRELWFANSIRHHAGIKKDTEWRRLADMPDQGRFGHEVAVLKGELYVFGGKKYYGTNDTLNSVYR